MQYSSDLMEMIESLISRDCILDAVQEYRVVTGAGRTAAKNFIENYIQERKLRLENDIFKYIEDGKKIEAIKTYRALYRTGLVDSKNAIERRIESLRREKSVVDHHLAISDSMAAIMDIDGTHAFRMMLQNKVVEIVEKNGWHIDQSAPLIIKDVHGIIVFDANIKDISRLMPVKEEI